VGGQCFLRADKIQQWALVNPDKDSFKTAWSGGSNIDQKETPWDINKGPWDENGTVSSKKRGPKNGVPFDLS